MFIKEYYRLEDLPKQVKVFLEQDELQNNKSLSFLNSIEKEPNLYNEIYFWVVFETPTQIIGFAHWVPHSAFFISKQSIQSAEKIIKSVRERMRKFTSIHGIKSILDPIIKDYQLQKDFPHLDAQRLYCLKKVKKTQNILHRVRTGIENDIPFLTLAYEQFSIECNLSDGQSTAKLWAENKIKKGQIYLGEYQDQTVCCAQIAREMPHGKVLSFVYTPKEFRAKGFASDLVAQLSQKILDMGAEYVCLFAQLANPTSNKIYQQIGYEYVEDFLMIQR